MLDTTSPQVRAVLPLLYVTWAEPSPVGLDALFDPDAMRRFLDETHADLRDHIRTLLQDPAFEYQGELSVNACREQVLQMARGLLSDFQRGFRDMNLPGMARVMAEVVATQVQKLNPVATRIADPGHLRALSFQQSAFTYRTEKQLRNVGQRLQRRIDDGMEPFDAFVDVQDHLVRCAQAEADGAGALRGCD
jgi:hypothetical protein